MAWLGLAFFAFSAHATAKINTTNYKALLNFAAKKEFVRVLVGLDFPMTLDNIANRTPKLMNALRAKEKELYKELGKTVSRSGRWSSGLGQLVIYVSQEGMERLVNSQHVKKIMLSPINTMLETHYDSTGSTAVEIENEIDEKGYAEVDVILNLKHLEFSYNKNGKTEFKQNEAIVQELKSKSPDFLGSLLPEHVQKQSNKKNQSKSEFNPVHTLKIDREGWYSLRDHPEIRALALKNTVKKAPRLDPQALAKAQRNGSAGVFINLYPPKAYSPQVGRMPAKAWKAQVDALQNSFDDILSVISPKGILSIQKFDGMASIYAVLTDQALQTLYRSKDARIQSIVANRAGIGGLLNNSTKHINMSYAWSNSYKGAGQSIVVMDSAFERKHPFFGGQVTDGVFVGGRLTYEACFGTNGVHTVYPVVPDNHPEYEGQFVSLCPNQNSDGDTPLYGIANTNPPPPQWPAEASNCSGDSSLEILCSHGTGVAGIAAGFVASSLELDGGSLSGVAPEANIIGISIMSKLKKGQSNPPHGPYDRPAKLWGTYVDLIAAMDALRNNTIGNSDITVNLSVGDRSNLTLSECNTTGDDNFPIFRSIVSSLLTQHVPVIAATGNDGKRDRMLWPACVKNVIKAAATTVTVSSNGTTAESFSLMSNIVNPNPNSNSPDAPYLGRTGPLLLAPGNVQTSALSDSFTTAPDKGFTSYAAPHIAGLYAVIKQAYKLSGQTATVAMASAWILDNGSHDLGTGLPSPNGYTIPSIKLP